MRVALILGTVTIKVSLDEGQNWDRWSVWVTRRYRKGTNCLYLSMGNGNGTLSCVVTNEQLELIENAQEASVLLRQREGEPIPAIIKMNPTPMLHGGEFLFSYDEKNWLTGKNAGRRMRDREELADGLFVRIPYMSGLSGKLPLYISDDELEKFGAGDVASAEVIGRKISLKKMPAGESHPE